VVGVPDAARGQIVKAVVVLRDPSRAGDATRQALQEHVKRRLAPYKYPRAIAFMDALPRTETGKVQRHVLRHGNSQPAVAPVPGT
jgi:2-aminobenzoate-CoA ligase